MVCVLWKIREEGVTLDHTRIYEAYPTMFTIELHHGGFFKKVSETVYVEGRVRYVDFVDIDDFSVFFQLDGMMCKLGYTAPPVIYYQFRIPHADLDFGLKAFENDDDVLSLAKYIPDNKLIEVYTEHGKTNLQIEDDEISNNDVQHEVHHQDDVEEQLGEYMSLILYGTTVGRSSRGDVVMGDLNDDGTEDDTMKDKLVGWQDDFDEFQPFNDEGFNNSRNANE